MIRFRSVNWRSAAAFVGTALLALTLVILALRQGVQGLREENRRRAHGARTERLAHNIEHTVFTPYTSVARDLAKLPEIIAVARHETPPDNREIVVALRAVQGALQASLAYVLDEQGTVVACTPYGDGQTLTGGNYAFRPYFLAARERRDCVYPALGVTTGVRGLYVTSPIGPLETAAPAGVMVLKGDFDAIDRQLADCPGPAALVSPDGVVLSSNRPNWMYRTAFPMDPARRAALLTDRQFADQPLRPLGTTLDHDEVGLENRVYTTAVTTIGTSGWRIVTLDPLNPHYPLTTSQMNGIAISIGFTSILLAAVTLLSANVSRRKRAELALRQANESLEIRVRERTQELAATNDGLEKEIAERRRAEQKLRHSERRLADIVAFLPDPTFVIDCAGRVTAWNQALEELTGIKADAMLGRGDYEYALPFYGHRRPVVVDLLLAPTPTAAAQYSHLERHADGLTAETVAPALKCGTRALWVAAKRLYDSEGNVVGAIESVRDISDRKRVELELRQTSAAAQAATRAKSEFLANMSHEIRTPMTSNLGYIDLVREGCPRHCEYGCDELCTHLDAASRSAGDLLRIINDILDLSKVEAGKLDIERVACSPVQLVREVEALMQLRVRSCGVRLSTACDGPIPETIQSDATRLKQILINLVGNALKFTPAGEVRIVTRLLSAKQGPRLQFEVTDTGVGMTAQQLGTLFQPFTQADASMARQHGGTGLGLAVSQRLAALLGGKISVTSSPGVGSTFRLDVDTGPLTGVHVREHVTPVTANPGRTHVAAPEPSPTLDGRILIAEDGHDNQRLLTILLQKAGAVTTVVENGKLAVTAALTARARAEPYDLILMDMQMPILDGYTATSLLRRRGYDGLIVALTAHAMSDDRIKCLAAGCDEFETKPIDRRHLISALRRLLDARRAPARTTRRR